MMQFAIKNTPIVIIVILAIMLTLEVVHQVVLTILIVMAHVCNGYHMCTDE